METNMDFKHNNHSALWGGENQGEQSVYVLIPQPLWGAQQCVTCVSGLQLLPSQAEPALHLHAAPLLCMAPFPVLGSGLCVWNTRPPLSTLATPLPAITFSIRLGDASEQTVLLPDELSSQLDVHIDLANPGGATANIF